MTSIGRTHLHPTRFPVTQRREGRKYAAACMPALPILRDFAPLRETSSQGA